jgi:CubicO group peptidase (beta-lactamase class C family)
MLLTGWMVRMCPAIIATFVSVGALASQCAASGEVADSSPAGKAFAEWLAEYNSGESTNARWARWYSVYGPLEVGPREVAERFRTRVWVRGRITCGWLGIDLQVDSLSPGAPARITVLQLGGALPRELASAYRQPVGSARIRDALAEYLNALEAQDYFSGVVLVTRFGNPVFEGAYGLASRRFDVPNRSDTKFSLASLGKVFTAVAVLQLAQSGHLSLTDTVGKFIPSYPVATVRGATVEQLLTHTSGIGRTSEDWIASRIMLPLDSLLARTAAEPMFSPGEGVRYSNEGFLLLGKIVERASGQAYEAYLREHIFDPAGMNDTGFPAWDEEVPNVATPYTNFRFVSSGQQVFVAGPRRNALMMHGMAGTPAGGAVSTAPDLASFAAGLLSGRLLDSAHLAAMMKPSVRQPPPFPSLGYGVTVGDENGIRRFGKGGDAQGVNTNWTVVPELGYVVIVLSNYDSVGDVVHSHILNLLGL